MTILGHWLGISSWIDIGRVLEMALSQLERHQLFSFRPVALEDRQAVDELNRAAAAGTN